VKGGRKEKGDARGSDRIILEPLMKQPMMRLLLCLQVYQVTNWRNRNAPFLFLLFLFLSACPNPRPLFQSDFRLELFRALSFLARIFLRCCRCS